MNETTLSIALAALEFYATLEKRRYDEPNLRREFGCGCCARINDANGDANYDWIQMRSRD